MRKVKVRQRIPRQNSKDFRQLDEGILDMISSFVGEILGITNDAFNSAKPEGTLTSLEKPPAKEDAAGGVDEFDPKKDPFDQVAAILSMLSTINSAVSPHGDLPDGLKSAVEKGQELIEEIKSIADGTHPHVQFVQGMAASSEGGATGGEGIDDAWDLMQQPYEWIVSDIAEDFGSFVSTLEDVEFSDEDWYQKIRQIADEAEPGKSATETVENWAKIVGEIERLKPAEQAQAIVDSAAVEEALLADERKGWLKDNVNDVRTEIGRYDKITELKSLFQEVHPLMEEVDKMMSEGAKFVTAAEEGEKEGEKTAAVQASIMSHYKRKIKH